MFTRTLLHFVHQKTTITASPPTSFAGRRSAPRAAEPGVAGAEVKDA